MLNGIKFTIYKNNQKLKKWR